MIFAGAGGVLAFLQWFCAVRLLGPRELGEFAVAAAFASTLEFISDFGIGDRLVQQDELALRDAFHLAITMQLMTAVPLWGVIYIAAPAIGHFYGLANLSALIRFMSFQAFGGVLRLPLFVLYRDLKYFQHRLLLFIGKVTAFAVTLVLAFHGHGAWSLAIGALAGLTISTIPAWYLISLAPGWRFRLNEVRSLASFSWPVWLSRVTVMLVEQGAVLVVSFALSVRDLGQYKSAEQLAHFALLVEVIFAQTIYPALCRVKHLPARLSAMLSRSSRAAMTVFAGCGFGLIIFAPQIVHLLLGSKWEGAELFLRAHGAGLLLGAVAFNWEAVFRAIGNTQPIFRVALICGLSFGALLCPLTYIYGRPGVAAGVVIVNLIGFGARSYYLNKLHLNTSMPEIVWRSFASGILAVFAVVVVRTFLGQASSIGAWTVELAVYLGVYSAILLVLERTLLVELRDVLRQRQLSTAG